MCKHGRRLGAEFGRTEKTISRTKFATDFFRKKIPFYRPKFLTTFIVIDQKFLLDTFLTQFVVSLISNNSTSQNIGGRMHGPSRHLKFGGTVLPAPLSLRPCV